MTPAPSLVALLSLALSFGTGCGRAPEPEGSGKVLYARYCASCHGMTGLGDGPAAGALVPPPTDLTRLDADVPELMARIDGRRDVRAHGSAAMPVWGEVFAQALLGDPHARRSALLHVQALAEHARGLQSGTP